MDISDKKRYILLFMCLTDNNENRFSPLALASPTVLLWKYLEKNNYEYQHHYKKQKTFPIVGAAWIHFFSGSVY